MTVVRLRTMDLPREDRFDCWQQLTLGSHIPMSIDSEHRHDFRATVEVFDFAQAQLSRLRYPALTGHRTDRLIRQSDPELLLVSYLARGRLIATQGREECVADASHVLVHDSSLSGSVTNDGPVTNIVLQFPRSAVDPKGALAGHPRIAPIPTNHGIGSVLAHLLTDLADHGATHPPAVTAALTATALDLVTTAARLATGSRVVLPADSRMRIRQRQINDYVRRRLADPALTPAAVAEAHGLSIRQLHRIFETTGVAPSAWIRRQRLEQCRRELTDPALAHQPVVAIGARWGYPDPATFNRAFRREFGVPPGEYRARFTRRADRGTDTAGNGE